MCIITNILKVLRGEARSSRQAESGRGTTKVGPIVVAISQPFGKQLCHTAGVRRGAVLLKLLIQRDIPSSI